MEQWIASVRDIAHRLNATNFKVQDIDLIIALTQGLSEEYTSMVVSLDATPIDKLTVDFVVSRLLNEEQRQNSAIVDPPGRAMVARHPSRPQWTPHSHSKSHSPKSKGPGSVAGSERSPRSTRCYNCGGRGHIARDCPSPKQEGNHQQAHLARDKDIDTRSEYSRASY